MRIKSKNIKNMKDKEIGLFVIEHDENGYQVLAVEYHTMRMTTFVRTPEYGGPNYIHRKTWFNDQGELESKSSVYDGQSDEDYKEMYDSGYLNEMPTFEDNKEEIFEKYKKMNEIC